MPEISVQTDADLPAIETLMAEVWPETPQPFGVAASARPPVPELCLVIRADGDTVGRCVSGKSCSARRKSCFWDRWPFARRKRARLRA